MLLNTRSASMKIIPATKGYNILVDDEDYDRLCRVKWGAYAGARGVARPARQPMVDGKRSIAYLAHEILKPPPGMVVDHINGDPWDNQRHNLRICTPAQNAKNRRKTKALGSKYKGVKKLSGTFSAAIGSDYRAYHLGCFPTEAEAAIAYDAAAKFLHGEYANLNFPNIDTPAASPEDIWAKATPQRESLGLTRARARLAIRTGSGA
jgi:hypothetical protein